MAKFSPKIEQKRWTPEMELEIQAMWEKERLYAFDPDSPKPKFSIDTPPPYASGKWHIAAAIHYAQIDMIARSMRMRGYEVYFPWGIDRNGLPVEVEAEKKYGIHMRQYPREEFLKLCSQFLDESEMDIVRIGKRLGISADFENIFRTDSVMWRAVTQATFIDAWNRGYVYEDYRPNNYCPRCATTLADAEIEYKELDAKLVYLKFKTEDGKAVTVATTRPELLPACAAVIYNPHDERYKWLQGKALITPLGRKVPVLEHPAVDPEFGTGLVMVCSYGDKVDVQLFRELDLEPTIIVDETGRLNERAGKYAGMTIKEARDAIIDDLRAAGLVERVEEIKHRTPVCWRCKTPIEIVPMKEYYLKQVEFLDELKRAALEEMKFYPDWSIQYLLDWISAVDSDWPVSRRRYYATEIPIWYCKACGKAVVPPPGRYYRPWKEDPPFDKCPHCGSSEGFLGEDRVFDTWMDSGISPLVYNGYGWNEELFKKLGGPSDLRPQGKDIVRTWLFYTLLRVYLAAGRHAFKHVWIGGMGLDAQGRAMHKSLGNIIYPWPMFERYGADAVRFFGAAEAHHGSDFRISEAKIAGSFKFLQKLWNVARFISALPMPEEEPKLKPTDLWILGEMNDYLRRALKGYENFDFFDPANSARTFVWQVFAPHYIELVKARAYGDEGIPKEDVLAARWTLHTVLRAVLRWLAPITPHITDCLWKQLYGGSVHRETMPEPEPRWDTEYKELGKKLMEFNSRVWKIKKGSNLPLSAEISIEIPEELKPFEDDLRRLHNIK